MEIKEKSDSSFVKIEKSDKNINNFMLEDSIRLNSIRDENLIECNPHNYQSYFHKVQIVGEYKFTDDHNKIYHKNQNLKINDEKINVSKKNIIQSNNSNLGNNNYKEIEKPEDIHIDDEKRDNSNNHNIVKDIREKEENFIQNEGLKEINKEEKIIDNVVDIKIESIEDKEKIPIIKNNIEKKHNTTCCNIL